jgi:hypothetical protein
MSISFSIDLNSQRKEEVMKEETKKKKKKNKATAVLGFIVRFKSENGPKLTQ